MHNLFLYDQSICYFTFVKCNKLHRRMFEKRDDFVYLADVAPKNKAEVAEKFPGRFFFTPKKAGAQTAEANANAGFAAANQICAFFESGCTKFQVNK